MDILILPAPIEIGPYYLCGANGEFHEAAISDKFSHYAVSPVEDWSCCRPEIKRSLHMVTSHFTPMSTRPTNSPQVTKVSPL